MKFKVGDIVKRKAEYISDDYDYDWNVKEHKVLEANEATIVVTNDPDRKNKQFRTSSWFDLATPVIMSELEQLVATANAGYTARTLLVEKYGDKVTAHYNTSHRREGMSLTKLNEESKIWVKELRIVAEKKFESYAISHGSVRLEGQDLKIGCKTFNAKELQFALARLCGGQSESALGLVKALAVRTGVRTNTSTEVLLWADAEQLLNKLTEYHS